MMAKHDWKKTVVSPHSTIRETVQIIDEGLMQIALVADQNGQLLGTVTDGDVRRGILRGILLNEPVLHIMNTNPITVSDKESEQTILSLMKRHKLRHIPVLDEKGCIKRLHVMDHYLKPELKENWTLLMAGGIGERLRPLTESSPKPLLRVGNKPILETILESLIEFGFHRFLISVNYKAEMIMEYFGNGNRWGIEIQYLREPKPMGTAGALSLIPFKPNHPLLVMNGDLLTKLNFQQLLEFHSAHKASATMCIHQYDFQVPYGVVKANDHLLLDIEEKPRQRFFVNAGIYVLDPEILNTVPKDACLDMTALLKNMMGDDKNVAVFPIREYWLDVGKMEDFKRANQDFPGVFHL